MIAPLRRRHGRLILGLVLVLPAAFAAALAARPPAAGPQAPTLPASPSVAAEGGRLLQDSDFHLVLLPGAAELLPQVPGLGPDLLAYACASDPSAAPGVPAGARLLGVANPVRATALQLKPTDGWLLVWCLARQEAAAVFPLPAGLPQGVR